MKKIVLAFLCLSSVSVPLTAQVCDPSVAPTGLTSTYTPGSGALLEWDAVPGSVGVLLKVDLPSGSSINKRIIGFERDQYFVPDALLTDGSYSWRVQAACSTVPPYSVTPISASNNFAVGSVSSCPATVTDIDGNVYSTVEIDSQCWMAENLMVERYRNGDAIPTGLCDACWATTPNGAFAVYNNVAANKVTYGLLYNWYAANDARGLCPTGWHVPTDAEQTQLISFLGGTIVAGGPMKTTGTLSAGTGLWQDPNTDATNSSGFSMLPGGNRYNYGPFDGLEAFGSFWSSSEWEYDSINFATQRGMNHFNGGAYRGAYNKHYGFSVRCLRD